MVREYLEFYSLDYTKNIFVPEVNLSKENPMSKQELTSKIGL
jgi:hypothetical protein